MADAQHTPPQDPSFRRSVLRNLAGAVGLVVLVAGIFGVLGMIGREDVDAPDLAIDDVPSEEASDDGADEPDVTEDPDPADDAALDDLADEEPGDDAGDAGVEEPDDGEPAPDAGSDEDPASDAADDEPEPTPDPPTASNPGEISVQVLDGFGTDGGAAADAVDEQLQDAGYDVVARNPALAYEVTTVLWTDGSEAEARQVAAEIGAAEVREQPGNLSTAVNVHVVIGADRG